MYVILTLSRMRTAQTTIRSFRLATMLTTPFLWTLLTMFMVLITMILCIMPIMLVMVISVGFRLQSWGRRCGHDVDVGNGDYCM